MSYVLEDSSEMTALANAIRTKSGQSGSMTVSQLTTAVNGISGGDWDSSYLVTTSSNAGSGNTTTVVSLPVALQGGNKDFFIVVSAGASNAGTIEMVGVFQYKSSNNSFTRQYSHNRGSGYISSAAWNDSSTKTQVKITASTAAYWRVSQSNLQHVLLIY